MSQDYVEFKWEDRAKTHSGTGFAYEELNGPLFLSVDILTMCNMVITKFQLGMNENKAAVSL